MKLSFEPHKISKDKFHPVDEHVIVTGMKFDTRITTGGIILPDDDKKSSGIRPRWSQVYKLGPNYDGELQEGDWILVSHGRWSRGIKIEDESGELTIRRVDPKDILLISDSPMEDETFTTKMVV